MNDSTANILVADGELCSRETLSTTLREAGYATAAAADGLTAWELLEAEPARFDVVILDRLLPGLDGVEVLTRIRQHAVLQGVPVILQTATRVAEPSPETPDPGVVHYLTRPLDAPALFRVLSAALEGRERMRRRHGDGGAVSGGLYAMREGAFVVRTLQSARAVANLVASACPEPRRVVVGLLELLVNAVEHGNLGISYEDKGRLCDEGRWEQEVEARLAEPANADKVVSVSYAREPECIRLVIKDEGQGFDWEKYLDIDPARVFDTHGRGIAMSRMLSFDSIEYRGTGNEVEVTIRLTED